MSTLTAQVSDFEPGDYVEIQAGKLFPHWNGRRGYVLPQNESGLAYGYVDVDVPEHHTSSWHAHHLILIDQSEGARAVDVLGEEYFG